MTKSKKSIVMHGMLLCPLVLGHCAFLRANGSDYRTSPVVAIHEQSGIWCISKRSTPTTSFRWPLSRWRPPARSRRSWPRARREVKTIRGNAP